MTAPADVLRAVGRWPPPLKEEWDHLWPWLYDANNRLERAPGEEGLAVLPNGVSRPYRQPEFTVEQAQLMAFELLKHRAPMTQGGLFSK
jgi:hypothetical protein